MRSLSRKTRVRCCCYVLLGLLVNLTASCRAGEEPLEVGITLQQEGIHGAVAAVQQVRTVGSEDPGLLRLHVSAEAIVPSADSAIAVADRFAGNPKIVAVVGHTYSATSLAASQVYNEHGLPHIAPVVTATMFSTAGPYSFRLVSGDDRQAEFLARQAVHLGLSARAAILFVNDDYGRGLHALLRERLSRVQIAESYDAPFLRNTDTTQFANAAESVGLAAPDLLFWLGGPEQLEIFLPLLRERLPDLRVIGSDGMATAVVYHNDGGRFTGLRFVRFVDPLAPNDRVVAVRRQYRPLAGHELTSLGLLTYDAVGLLAEALTSGVGTREGVREYLVSLGRSRAPYDGVAGPIQFDENGDAIRSFLLAEVTAAGVRAVEQDNPRAHRDPNPETHWTGHGGPR